MVDLYSVVSNLHFMYFSIGILDIICEFCVCMCCKLARELSRELSQARSPSSRHTPSNHVSPPFPFYLWPRPELRAHILRVLILPGNPEFRARDERSFVIFSVHVHTYISVPAPFVPHQSNCILAQNATYPWFLDSWRCENNGLQRVYICLRVSRYIQK